MSRLEAENRRLLAAQGSNPRVAELENRLDDSEKLNERLQQDLAGLSRRLAEAEAARTTAAKADADARAVGARTEELTKRVRQLEAENKQYLADIDALVRQATNMKVRSTRRSFIHIHACLCSKRLRRCPTRSCATCRANCVQQKRRSQNSRRVRQLPPLHTPKSETDALVQRRHKWRVTCWQRSRSSRRSAARAPHTTLRCHLCSLP